MIKLIATDMDGTWLNDKKTFNWFLFNRIFKIVQENNIKFVVASGNELQNLWLKFSNKANGIYYIAENGALIAKGKQIIYTKIIPDSSLKEIKSIIKHYKFPFILAGLKSAYVRKSDGLKYYWENKKHFTKLRQVSSFDGVFKREKIIKAACWVPNDKQSFLVKKFNKEFSHTSFVAGGHLSIDMQGKGRGKSTALHYLGSKLGISADNMIAFGDSGNDVAMLKYVGYSYATSTALKEAKNAADEVIGSNNENAVQLKFLKLLKQ